MKKDNNIYQSFDFKYDIQNYFYCGDLFLNKNIKNELSLKKGNIDNSVSTIIEMNNNNDFLFKLRKKIEQLIGEGNFKYDYYSFNENYFSLYWLISKDVYNEKMNLIQNWIKYEELEDLIWFKIKDI